MPPDFLITGLLHSQFVESLANLSPGREFPPDLAAPGVFRDAIRSAQGGLSIFRVARSGEVDEDLILVPLRGGRAERQLLLSVDAVIDRTAIPGLDWIVSFPVGAALVTVFVVAGVANSLNIIDGFNGLSSMCGVLILSCLCYVAAVVGDTLVMQLALAGIGAIFGFFVWNFPAGLIFLGDGGAYFVGFYVAELAILLRLSPDLVASQPAARS